MITFIIFLAVLSLLVFVHEFGHFIAARKMGVAVEEFGFGFPPRLWGTKRNGTIYSINWIPLGGFVRLKGETGEFANQTDSYSAKKIGARTIIVAAGVLMNFLLAIVLFSVGFMAGLPNATDDLPAGARVRDPQVAIGRVLEGSPAAESGFKPNDIIISIDNERFISAEAVQEYIRAHEGTVLKVKVKQDEEEKVFEVEPRMLAETGKIGLGVGLFSVGIVSFPWYLAPIRATQLVAGLTVEILRAFGHIIRGLVLEGRLVADVSGPVGIAVLTGRAAALGISYLIQFVAVLSINLAVINFLPLPALDGGRFLFLVIEKIRRKPVDRKLESVIHQIGFALLLALVLLVTYRDLAQFLTKS